MIPLPPGLDKTQALAQLDNNIAVFELLIECLQHHLAEQYDNREELIK